MTTARPDAGRRILAICSAAAMFFAACSSRPSVDEWSHDWQALLDQVPPIESLRVADDDSLRAICSTTLGNLRSAVVDMEHAPSQHIEHTAITYLEFAESVFFECPIHRGDYAGFEAGYEEMGRLAAAVEALIAPREP